MWEIDKYGYVMEQGIKLYGIYKTMVISSYN